MKKYRWNGPVGVDPSKVMPDITNMNLDEIIELAEGINFSYAYSDDGTFNDKYAWNIEEVDINNPNAGRVIVWNANQNMPSIYLSPKEKKKDQWILATSKKLILGRYTSFEIAMEVIKSKNTRRIIFDYGRCSLYYLKNDGTMRKIKQIS